MPKLSDTMEEGSVLTWIKKDGDEVKRGEVLAEIETDKASFEIESEADGVLRVVVGEGKPVPVGGLIATIGEDAPRQAAPAPAPPPAEPRQEAAAEPGPAAVEPDTDQAEPAAPEAEPEPARASRSEPAPAPRDGDVRASPLARRLAREMGVDLGSIRGSGPEGRVVKEDVLAAAESRPGTRRAASEERRPAAAQVEGPAVEVIEPTRMQASIAKRMALSKTTVPHFYVTVEARMDQAVRVRQQLIETVPGAEKVSYTDMLVRACAIALGRHPEINASWTDGRFERKRAINIGIAVALERGLIVPVIRDADRKDLVQISIESRQLVERTRAGKASQSDLTGGTFSISNLGMFGVDEFSAIVNPPEAAILAVGGIKDAAVVEDGRVVAGKVMRMTVSADHRTIYGAEVARFLAEVRTLMENPVSLVLPPTA